MSRVLKTGENQITNPYGGGHGGVDVVKRTNALDEITAHSAGTVVFCQVGVPNARGSSGNRSYGNCVKIRHENGFSTLYAHMENVRVKGGAEVKQGDVIGYMGNTGNSYGAHLHFEVRDKNDSRIDPTPYLDDDLPATRGYAPGTYRVDAAVLTVREGAGTGFGWKRFAALTTNAQKQIKALNPACPNGYVRGVICDVSEVKSEWGKTPSGWIHLGYCTAVE